MLHCSFTILLSPTNCWIRVLIPFRPQIISMNDSLICLFMTPQIPVMIRERKPSLFAGPYNCYIWLNIYQLFIRMSIALTATLSVSRTRSLVRCSFIKLVDVLKYST